ncbi:MAG: four helix bundle protein [Muribaculaceae bacterium]|nr:four helix bundle protein [Muribaculaceae bacterium]
MAVYTNLPVYEECYQLFLHFTQLSMKMQRDYRYSLGEDVKKLLMAVILDIYKANYKKDAAGLESVTDAKDRMVELQVILRLLNEVKQIPDRHYMMLTERTVSISKQLVGWEKAMIKSKR